ncbi:transcriptional regulator, AraC family with amidase-like domain [Nocardia amikacinitolerans]|uniref:Transcriptional regulator, AraC family with amidase-like domain n=1 Tax=Nocardia amikacinitolerans TaxID=756689 RepID=A0A285LQ40_9NOCA|nr:helix-turn-helix domain-containing protein [Nocardia amikacinitolerans]MCP2278105.1 transcriptional regulator, AraC family with amidase-like domain [Nocardia amikacinitolerans]SNY87060.1 transcriptional regulator, AraC family with amidase-like domain [Nocardia amikacinitolerans]
MHIVAVLALDGVVGFELAIPGQVFGTANRAIGSDHYDIRIAAPGRSVATDAGLGAVRLHTAWDLDTLVDADTIIIPSRVDYLAQPPEPALDALRAAAARGTRLASVCIGAFTLAATGLLDGKRATTHWQHAAELAQRYPRIDVDPEVLFIDNGLVLTSAGVAAGLDLCLHMLRHDLGAARAAATARRIVMPPQRDGGQAQFIEYPDPRGHDAFLQDTLDWMEANLHRPLTLHDIARHARTSIRSLNRHFRAQIGTTPLQWLLRARANRAQQLLETTAMSIDRIAEETGFGASNTLRYHFTRLVGISPQAYRTTFQTANPA